MVIQIPLSQSGDPKAFAAALEAHCVALAKHRIGKPGVPVPVHQWDHLIARVTDTGPVVSRKPDSFVILPYVIVDDTPKTPEQQTALNVLRETLGS